MPSDFHLYPMKTSWYSAHKFILTYDNFVCGYLYNSTMLMTHGVSIALINSIVNALCDPLRKYLTRFMDPFNLVATRGLIQAPLFCLWALIDNNFRIPHLNYLFWTSVCISGCINIVTSYLYNRSLQISSLSATIPFLSFTPAFLLIVGFLVLGEVPSSSGVIGKYLYTVTYILNLYELTWTVINRNYDCRKWWFLVTIVE
jgi:uncharacterized membrane protein